MGIIGVGQLQHESTAVFERLEGQREPFLITRHGQPSGALLPIDLEGEFASRAGVRRLSVRDLLREAKASLASVEAASEPVIVTRHGRDIAVLAPIGPGDAERYVLAAAPGLLERRYEIEASGSQVRLRSLDDIANELDLVEPNGLASEEDAGRVVALDIPIRRSAPETVRVSMSINGRQYSHEIGPRLLLVHYIREYAELHGTQWGCDTSSCGICVVLLDGQPIKSCTMLATVADGHEITTVEGLEKEGVLDPIQQGFQEMHALQCGFCTPGLMVTGRWLIDKHPNPAHMTDHEIRQAISGNACRCTGYANIVKAIKWAAAREKSTSS